MPDSATLEQTDIQHKSINTIRCLAIDAVEAAQSGHPGMPMGTAPLAYTLWKEVLKHNPSDPDWFDRDRFVLSAGHGSMLLYSLLHLTGYDLPLSELKNFRQWKSKTPGHPENFVTTGVETTTGPLGQGFANAVGMAIAEKHLAATFNEPDFPIVDHFTYGICSDGDLMEGIAAEAASMAGHYGLGKLIFFYDQNEITIDGHTDLAFTEDVRKRFDAYDWHTIQIEDGTDLDAIRQALKEARAETERPTLILTRTIIGHGSPNQANTADAHGSPLGSDEARLTKKNLGWPEDETFLIPDDVREHLDAHEAGREVQQEWEKLFAAYKNEYPEKAAQLTSWINGDLPDDWEESVPSFDVGDDMASRAASGKVLDKLAPAVGCLIGGSADLAGSNKTMVAGRKDFQRDNPSGGYFHFGVREHGMAGACNGMSRHGGLRTYCATFLIFSDYLRPSLRLSALMGEPVIYVLTHDSIGLGEDGPTHQPVEHLMALRAIPNLTLLRPADANEVAESWKAAIRRTEGPSALVLTRQGLPTVDRSKLGSAGGVQKGAYILFEPEDDPDVLLIGTGSEVQHALTAARTLADDGIAAQVVSMPSWELFEEQDASYKESVLPPSVQARVAIEAGITFGWERYVGDHGAVIGVDRFGSSAPGDLVMREFGFTAERVEEEARTLLER